MINDYAIEDGLNNTDPTGIDLDGEPVYALPALVPGVSDILEVEDDIMYFYSSSDESSEAGEVVIEAEVTTGWTPARIEACLRELGRDFERGQSEPFFPTETVTRRLAVARMVREYGERVRGLSPVKEDEGNGNEERSTPSEERVYSFVKVWHTFEHSDGGLKRKVSKGKASQHLKNARKRLAMKLRSDGLSGRHSSVVALATLDAGANVLSAEMIAELRRRYVGRSA